MSDREYHPAPIEGIGWQLSGGLPLVGASLDNADARRLKATVSDWAHGMNIDSSKVLIRTADDSDARQLQDVRRAAFAPVFASFRAILGKEISEVTQARDDEAQAEYLASLFLPSSGWELYVAEQEGLVVGFVSIKLNLETSMGEIGLNAVHPDFAGAGIGTAMYDAVLERMREAGMHVATVSTGGDSSHAPARRAYQKAGFNVGIPSIWLCQRL